MIIILYEMIKILHEKMLNAIYLYWFHNDTLAENKSLNGYSKKPWINERGSSYFLSSTIFLLFFCINELPHELLKDLRI